MDQSLQDLVKTYAKIARSKRFTGGGAIQNNDKIWYMDKSGHIRNLQRNCAEKRDTGGGAIQNTGNIEARWLKNTPKLRGKMRHGRRSYTKYWQHIVDEQRCTLVEKCAEVARNNATQAADLYKTLGTYGRWANCCPICSNITPNCAEKRDPGGGAIQSTGNTYQLKVTP